MIPLDLLVALTPAIIALILLGPGVKDVAGAALSTSAVAASYAAMLMPSHEQMPFSTARIWSAVSVPRRFISRTVGTVTMPWTSKAPDFKNFGDAAVISKRD
jgi:hypothetical protein